MLDTLLKMADSKTGGGNCHLNHIQQKKNGPQHVLSLFQLQVDCSTAKPLGSTFSFVSAYHYNPLNLMVYLRWQARQGLGMPLATYGTLLTAIHWRQRAMCLIPFHIPNLCEPASQPPSPLRCLPSTYNRWLFVYQSYIYINVAKEQNRWPTSRPK